MIKQLIAEYLSSTLDVPFRYTMADLVRDLDIPPGTEYKRRHRELRDLGWVINTYREDPTLERKQYELIKIGDMPK